MCIEAGLCVISSFERLKKIRRTTVRRRAYCNSWVGVRYSWVGVRSLCVEYGWLCAGHASPVSAYASELVRNITHEPRTYHVYRETKVLVRGTFAIHASDMRRMLVEYCTVFARMRRRARYFSDSSVIVNYTCSVHAWFMRDSSVISTPDTTKIWSISRRKSTHKPNLSVICEWFVLDRLCGWPFNDP